MVIQMSSRWMSPVKLTAKQVLFDYHIWDIPSDGIYKILNGENIEMIDVDIDDESCGMYCIENDQRKIYVNQNMILGRRNFTIAHELGHHFLDHTLVGYCSIHQNLAIVTHQKEPQEVEANYFAACFLMPYDLVMPLFNAVVSSRGRRKDNALNLNTSNNDVITQEIVSQMENQLKVSQEAAFYRLKNLKLLVS